MKHRRWWMGPILLGVVSLACAGSQDPGRDADRDPGRDADRDPGRAEKAVERQREPLSRALAHKGLSLGAPIFIRIFKQESELELWVEKGGRFELFRTYPICTWSGELGPKLRQGDGQAPEGFYFVTPGRMNPRSRYHLSFNLGYPNAYDRAHGRTGDFLMVHGDCVSIGCYAMTDPVIEEIWTLAMAAFDGGQPYFRVHAFPFRLGGEALARQREHRWYPFWQNLKTGYDWFEREGTPPDVTVEERTYRFGAP
ncbi:2-dehydro-3-deoxyphosphooctonate aldolase [Acidobacteria bacterium Mor1]|nr:2-dehydro-3-deoxyphosphooctonate aldolase [Acidobacteria bacterium Mor1]